MFLCLYLLLLRALAGIMLSLSLDPWSWPGMTVSRALVVFSGCLLLISDRRTEEQKRYIENQMHIQARLMFFCFFNVMHLRCCSYILSLLLFLRTEEEYVFFFFRSYKNVFYKKIQALLV